MPAHDSTKSCPVCHGPIIVLLSDGAGRKKKYCSKACAESAAKALQKKCNSDEAPKSCPICGKPVPAVPRGRQRIFCSEKCSDISSARAQAERRKKALLESRQMIPCPVCGTEFKQWNKRMFCSVACKEKHRRQKENRINYLNNYREINKEQYREQARHYMRARLESDPDFKERQRENYLKWKAGNPEKCRTQKIRRRGMEAARDDGTANVAELLAERKTCPYCGKRITKDNYHIDHMDSLHLGGSNSQCNLTVCCVTCNLKKSAKSYLDWVASLPPSRRSPALAWYKRKHGHGPEQASFTLTFAA